MKGMGRVVAIKFIVVLVEKEYHRSMRKLEVSKHAYCSKTLRDLLFTSRIGSTKIAVAKVKKVLSLVTSGLVFVPMIDSMR